MAFHSTSAVTCSLVQSRLVGDSAGSPFNDIETVGRYPADLTINMETPIESIEIMYGTVIDGIAVTYNESATFNQPTVSHGTQPNCKDPSLDRLVINLEKNEDIIAVTGKHGACPPLGMRVMQLSFVIYNNTTGECRIATTINQKYPESEKGGKHFRVTAHGEVVGIGGYAVNTNLSIEQAIEKDHYFHTHCEAKTPNAGLFGLTFTEAVYHKAS